MSVLLEKTSEPVDVVTPSRTFHLRMAGAGFFLLAATIVGCRITSIHVNVSGPLVALILVCGMLAPLAAYWHEKGRVAYREAVLVLPWGVLLAITIPFTVLAVARFDLPLRDGLFGRADDALGVSVPGIVAWAGNHRLGAVINRSYDFLIPFLAVAGLLPALTGKVRSAREFLIANLAAFVIGIPAFALLPAVGPWVFYHTVPNSVQLGCQLGLLQLRLPGPCVPSPQEAGLICFPSFHVIWAILCAAALWCFRPLRIPVVLISAMIVLSTLTTGWHYFTDVVAGAIIAVLSLAIARVFA